MRAARWAAGLVVLAATALFVAGPSRVNAQVPPITIPGQTTTTEAPPPVATTEAPATTDRKSTRLNSSH